MSKICCNCKIERELSLFSKHKSQKDGLNRECKLCVFNRQEKNKEKKAEYDRNYNKLNRLTISIRSKKYRKDNRDALYASKKEYLAEKEVSDVNYKLARRLRSRLYKVTNGIVKSGSSVKDLGCTVEFLREYLESQFQPGMTWENWGKNEGFWQIDHIQPLCSFDLIKREEFLKACHYTNLQPLWFENHILKTNKDMELLR